MLNAATDFDTAGFRNPAAGMFGWSLGGSSLSLSLSYTPSAVPEPGAFLLTAAGPSLGWVARRRQPSAE
jgi:hypothetical protein